MNPAMTLGDDAGANVDVDDAGDADDTKQTERCEVEAKRK